MDLYMVDKHCERLQPIRLPHPQIQAKLCQYFYDDDRLQLLEPIRYSDPHRSWFLDNTLSRAGQLTQLTRVDPLFVLLPHIVRFASDKFRTILDICSSYDEWAQTCEPRPDKLERALSPDLNWDLICDTQQVDDEVFVRYSESKTIDWLLNKVTRTEKALAIAMRSQGPSGATILSYALDLLAEYLSEDLAKKIKLAARRRPVREQFDNIESDKPPASKITTTSPSTTNSTTSNKRPKNTKNAPKTPLSASKQPIGLMKYFTSKRSE